MIGTGDECDDSKQVQPCFSLLLAELMIGTGGWGSIGKNLTGFQSPISGVNDWNNEQVYEQVRDQVYVSVSY